MKMQSTIKQGIGFLAGSHNFILQCGALDESAVKKLNDGFQNLLDDITKNLQVSREENSLLFDEMERLIAEKMESLLFKLDISQGYANDGIQKMIQNNAEKIQDEMKGWLDDVMNGINKLPAINDKLATIQAESRKASTALAENTIVLNKIYDAISGFGEHQEKISEMVGKTAELSKMNYAQLLEVSGQAAFIKENMLSMEDYIKSHGELLNANEEIMNAIKAIFKKIEALEQNAIKAALKSDKTNYDDVKRAVYRFEDTVRMDEEIKNALGSGNEPGEILYHLTTLERKLHTQLERFEEDGKLFHADVVMLHSMQSPLAPEEKCPRCDSVEARVYECKVCGFRRKNISPKEKAKWLPYKDRYSFVPPEKGLLKVRAVEDEKGVVDIGRFSTTFEYPPRKNVKKIIFHENVKHVVLNGKNENIRSVFQNLEAVSFLGTEEITLGSNLFKGCKDKIEFFGLKNRYKTVKLGRSCFAGWTDDGGHADFLVETFGNASIEKEDDWQNVDDWRK